MNSFQFEAGCVMCGAVRDFLAAEKLKGRDIRWHEGSGWFSRQFTVAGAPADVRFVSDRLRDWIRQLDAEDAAAKRAH